MIILMAYFHSHKTYNALQALYPDFIWYELYCKQAKDATAKGAHL